MERGDIRRALQAGGNPSHLEVGEILRATEAWNERSLGPGE